MAKAVWEGALEIAGAAAIFAVAPMLGPAALAFVTSTAGSTLIAGIGVMGIGQEISAIADAFKAGPSTGVMTRQAAQPRRVIYGLQRVSPTLVFQSTTGSAKRLNEIACWCSHSIENIVALYMDGKEFHAAHNGVNGSDGTWGQGDGQTYTSEAGNQYTFGSGVYVEHRFGYAQQTVRDKSGSSAPLYMTSLQGNDAHWNSTCQLNGVAYSYVKLDYDTKAFPSGMPQLKATIAGKNDILDPRTGTRGYTNNAALVIADFLCNQDWGLRAKWSEIDFDELIASANVCDEQVQLLNGSSEPRYTINGTFTCDSIPGETLSAMLMACDGRVSYISGKYKVVVGYDRGASVAFDEGDFSDLISFSPYRSERGRFNSVQGTFICPRYPYVASGNYYNQDRWEQGTFDGAWQPTNAPQFDLSAARGYTQYPLTDEDGNTILDATGNQEMGDKYMAADNGQRLYIELKQQFVTSVSQWQRLAKIKLMRHRQELTATLPVRLTGLKVCAGDNILVTSKEQGWINKEFEVNDWSLVSKESDGAIKLETELKVTETDPALIYAWDTSDELALNSTDYVSMLDGGQITAPSSLVLTSTAATGVTTSDGLFQPRILAQWTAAPDGMVTAYRVEVAAANSSVWNTAATVSSQEVQAYIAGVVQNSAYQVRVCSLRQNGAASDWIIGGVTVSSTQSSINSGALSPSVSGQANVFIDSVIEKGATTTRVYGPPQGSDGTAWTYSIGGNSTTVPAVHFTGQTGGVTQYLAYNVSTQSYVVTNSYSDPALQGDQLLFLGYLKLATATDPGTTGSYGNRP